LLDQDGDQANIQVKVKVIAPGKEQGIPRVIPRVIRVETVMR
jgi:hypothetical protein